MTMPIVDLRKFAKIDNGHRHVCPSVRMKQLGSHWKDFS
jgi:hypothetical protein